MTVAFDESLTIKSSDENGFMLAELTQDAPGMKCTLSAKLPKRDYSLSQIREAVFAELDRMREQYDRSQ